MNLTKSFKSKINKAFRWFVRCRIYSDYGIWWLPGFELILGVFGVVAFGLWGILAPIGFLGISLLKEK